MRGGMSLVEGEKTRYQRPIREALCKKVFEENRQLYIRLWMLATEGEGYGHAPEAEECATYLLDLPLKDHLKKKTGIFTGYNGSAEKSEFIAGRLASLRQYLPSNNYNAADLILLLGNIEDNNRLRQIMHRFAAEYGRSVFTIENRDYLTEVDGVVAPRERQSSAQGGGGRGNDRSPANAGAGGPGRGDDASSDNSVIDNMSCPRGFEQYREAVCRYLEESNIHACQSIRHLSLGPDIAEALRDKKRKQFDFIKGELKSIIIDPLRLRLEAGVKDRLEEQRVEYAEYLVSLIDSSEEQDIQKIESGLIDGIEKWMSRCGRSKFGSLRRSEEQFLSSIVAIYQPGKAHLDVGFNKYDVDRIFTFVGSRIETAFSNSPRYLDAEERAQELQQQAQEAEQRAEEAEQRAEEAEQRAEEAEQRAEEAGQRAEEAEQQVQEEEQRLAVQQVPSEFNVVVNNSCSSYLNVAGLDNTRARNEKASFRSADDLRGNSVSLGRLTTLILGQCGNKWRNQGKKSMQVLLLEHMSGQQGFGVGDLGLNAGDHNGWNRGEARSYLKNLILKQAGLFDRNRTQNADRTEDERNVMSFANTLIDQVFNLLESGSSGYWFRSGEDNDHYHTRTIEKATGMIDSFVALAQDYRPRGGGSFDYAGLSSSLRQIIHFGNNEATDSAPSAGVDNAQKLQGWINYTRHKNAAPQSCLSWLCGKVASTGTAKNLRSALSFLSNNNGRDGQEGQAPAQEPAQEQGA